jgi:hypothetical protein
MSVDDANGRLWMASQLRLLAEEGDGYLAAVLYCPACYVRALELLDADLDRE